MLNILGNSNRFSFFNTLGTMKVIDVFGMKTLKHN